MAASAQLGLAVLGEGASNVHIINPCAAMCYHLDLFNKADPTPIAAGSRRFMDQWYDPSPEG
eukprot:scaffold1744_cov252-Pinguiococcus_pyrenoidosus.AAC.6